MAGFSGAIKKTFNVFRKTTRDILKSANLKAHSSNIQKMLGRGIQRGMSKMDDVLGTRSFGPANLSRKNLYGKFSKLSNYANAEKGIKMAQSNERMVRTVSEIATRGRRVGWNAMKGVAQHTFLSHGVQLGLGATAMASIGIMNGAMNEANNIMMERYMRDQRYGLNMMRNASLGKASAGPKLSLGNHTGLSLALSKTRHGH